MTKKDLENMTIEQLLARHKRNEELLKVLVGQLYPDVVKCEQFDITEVLADRGVFLNARDLTLKGYQNNED